MTTLQEDKDQQKADSNQEHPKSLWPICFAIVAIAGMICGVLAFKDFNKTTKTIVTTGVDGVNQAIDKGVDLAKGVAERMRKVFQAEVKVSNNSFTLAQKDIAELAVVQRNIVCVTKYEATYLKSKGMVIIRGVYHVKAGFDLGEGFSMRLDEVGKVLSAKLPQARLLSVTPEKQEVFHSENGLWKEIQPKDLEEAYRLNLEQAKKEAADNGLLKDAEERLVQRMTDVLAGDAKLEIEKPDLASKL